MVESVESRPQVVDRPSSTLDAFVSYSRRDAPVVLAFVDVAKARGRSMWIDADDIPPAAPWRTELGTAIEAANAVVCCLSPDWLRSVECRREYERAVELGKRLIPVLVADIDESPAELAGLQWINAGDDAEPADVATAVLAAIDTDLDRVREHTHWLSRALRWEARQRDRSLLLRGKDLRAAEEWLTLREAQPAPVPLQTELIVASRHAERRRLQITTMVALTTVAVMIVLATAALIQWAEAVNQRKQAQSRALAAASQSQLDVDPERSLLLATKAWSTASTTQAVTALRSSLQRSRVRITIKAHSVVVSGVAWSPDGRSVISAARDGTVKAWDSTTGTQQGQFDVGPGAVERLSVASASATGVVVTDKGRAVIWFIDPATHLLTQRAVLAEAGVADAAISDDGRVVVAGLTDGTVGVWTPMGNLVSTLRWDRSAVRSLALSADGRTLLVGTVDGAALAGPIGGERPARLASYAYPVSMTQLSADGSLALTAADDGSGSVRRVSDGSQTLALPPVFEAAIDATGHRAVVARVDGQVDMLVLGGNAVPLLPRGVPASTVRFSADGTRVMVAQRDGVARAWQVTNLEPLDELRGSSGSINRAALSPDGQRLLTGHRNGEIHVWAMTEQPLTLQNNPDLGSGLSVAATSVAFSPDGKTILTASRDGLARTWDAHTGRETPAGDRCNVAPMGPHCLASQTSLAQGLWLTRAVFSRDGRLIATSGQSGSLVVWDAATADQVSRAPEVRVPIDDVAFSPDGRQLATAERDGRTRLIDAQTGRVTAEFRASDKSVYAVSFTPDGHAVITAGEDKLVRMWDIERRSPRLLADAGDGVLALAVDPGGRQVAVASNDQILLLDVTDGHRVRTLVGHRGFVTSVVLSPDGGLLASGGIDGTVRVWDVQSGDEAANFRVPGGYVTHIGIDGEGLRLAAATKGGRNLIFDCEVCRSEKDLVALAVEHATRALTPEERSKFNVP